MTLTPDQLRQTAAAMIAHAGGKPIQYNHFRDGWLDDNSPSWDFETFEYRPKPEPKTRPWSKPEDVPGPVCWIRSGGMTGVMIVGLTEHGVILGTGPYTYWDWSQCTNHCAEYSTDRREWKPCEVTE